MGSQRIVSKLGSSDIFTIRNPLTDTTANKQNFVPKLNDLTGKIKVRYDSLGVVYKGVSQGNAGLITSTAGRITTPLKYHFHSDHLGSSSLITDATGGIVQHLEYIPFGEVFIDERAATSTWSTPYKFNAKELDEETGLYYYGARYYDPRTSVWISVDPLSEKYPNVSSYVYCLNNPVKIIDPDGKDIIFVNGYRLFGSSNVSQNKLKDTYWNIVNKGFTNEVERYFNDHTTHFITGDHAYGSKAVDRIAEGKTIGINMVKSGEIKVSKDNSIMTLVMHSQGNAEGVGVAIGIIDQAKRQGVDVKVNLVFLSVHQPNDISKSMSNELKKRGIQFTYANDNFSLVQPMAKQKGSEAGLTGVVDANSYNINWIDGGRAAHSATIDDTGAFNAIKKVDQQKKIFIGRPSN
jgi:RHS repeat-associated protein